MRSLTDAEAIRRFARALGREARVPARVYLVGGATAVLEGWRAMTVDLDLAIEPDDEILRLIAGLKERLGVSVELAAPADFLPELPGWRERSPFLFREGVVEFFHYDLYAQALAKLRRGLGQDEVDVAAMLSAGLVVPARLGELFAAVADQLYRFPAVDSAGLARAVAALGGSTDATAT